MKNIENITLNNNSFSQNKVFLDLKLSPFSKKADYLLTYGGSLYIYSGLSNSSFEL